MCFIWIMRTAFMNCSFPLSKSILNDYTTKGTRNTWNSFESIASFGWSGSAVLGGWMLGKCVHPELFLCLMFSWMPARVAVTNFFSYRFGYEWVFICTFGLQLAMLIPNWMLLHLVSKEVTNSNFETEQVEALLDRRLSSGSAATSLKDFGR